MKTEKKSTKARLEQLLATDFPCRVCGRFLYVTAGKMHIKVVACECSHNRVISELHKNGIAANVEWNTYSEAEKANGCHNVAIFFVYRAIATAVLGGK